MGVILFISMFICLGHADKNNFGSDFSSKSMGNNGIRPVQARLRMMSFNLWYSGLNVFNGLEKIARHINAINPDVVALQDVEARRLDSLLTLLTGHWDKCNDTTGAHNAPYIISRMPVVRHYTPVENLRSVGCQILLDKGTPNLVVNVWNVHLVPKPYGPHVACFHKHTHEHPWELSEIESDFNNEYSPKRLNSIRTLIRDHQFESNLDTSDVEPLILAGDFNSPSHLDWISSTRHLHCNRVFAWPCTELLDKCGLLDSYRELHPDPLKMPGFTWSPILAYNRKYNASEPQDRIDFVFYKSQRVKPVASRVYQGAMHLSDSPNHAGNDWPSNHASIVTDFDVYRV